MKFYSYWEGGEIPPYLKLCVQTWFKFIPDLEVELIDQAGSRKWTAEYYDFDNFKQLSYPMQSDAVSAAVLAKEGGTFIDLDTIFTSSVAAKFFTEDLEKLKAFGAAPGLHIAILSTARPNDPVATTWRAAVARRIADLPAKRPWNYIGNAPLEKILADDRWRGGINIIDRKTSGNILEAVLGDAGAGPEGYRELFFGDSGVTLEEAIEANAGGIISLHNSWTPVPILRETNMSAILEKEVLFSQLIKNVLGESPKYVVQSVPQLLQIKTLA